MIIELLVIGTVGFVAYQTYSKIIKDKLDCPANSSAVKGLEKQEIKEAIKEGEEKVKISKEEIKQLEKERKDILSGNDTNKADKAQEKLDAKNEKIKELAELEANLYDLKALSDLLTSSVSGFLEVFLVVFDQQNSKLWHFDFYRLLKRTPSNDLKQAGVSPDQQHQEWLKWREDNKKYMEEKTDELFKDLKERNKELQEENKKIAEQIKNSNDPAEKARLMEMMSENKKEIAKNSQTMAEEVSKLKKALESFGTQPLTQQQFQAKADSPNLSSFKN
ncbi:13961_t:CDS:2 [Ambispora leptoticha]|uniref:13961_t:CDS:1 n=1 Tax=Ambispora leptoticha TaxID=144679 RepID=A0A9N9A7G6_9GLOM|nr:13961_t:CDS:2 [Ambispora leptoticha]